MKKLLRPGLFLAAGAAAGLLYYQFFACRTGCPITSSPIRTMLYTALIGWLIHIITKKENPPSCNT